jgi:hypothetical protein
MKILRIASRAGVLALFMALISRHANAQDNPAQAATNPPDSGSASTSGPSTSAPSGIPFFNQLFQQKLPVEFGFRIGQSHSDNIYFQTRKTSDYITEISPSLDYTLGQKIRLAPQLDQETIDDETDSGQVNYLQLSYRPTLNLYANNPSLDDVDEYASAIYTHQFSRLTLSISQTYEKLSSPTVQVNAQGTLIHRDIFTTVANANYAYSDQLSTYGTVSQTMNNYISSNYTDNTEWSADYYFLYQLFPKLSLGFGPRIGFDDITSEANQSFQTGLAHLQFAASGKVTFTAAVGEELREFQADSSPEKATPILEASAFYHPFDSTTIELDGNRHRIVANGQPGSDYTASIGTLTVKQRFFQVVYATVSGGYEEDEYTGAVGNGPSRDDKFFFLQGGIRWESYRGIILEGDYQYYNDRSNVEIYTFNESRATISATVKY